MTSEEEFILNKWRSLSKWGSLEVIKQNGRLFEVNSVDKERFEDEV